MEKTIDQAFAKMIKQYRVHVQLGITKTHVHTLRHQVKNGITISIDKKFRLLRKSGWQPDHHRWTDHDMVELLKFCIKKGKAAQKQLGAAYIFDSWKNLQ